MAAVLRPVSSTRAVVVTDFVAAVTALVAAGAAAVAVSMSLPLC